MAKERFIVEKANSSAGTSKIIIDTQTGVNYLFHRDNVSGGTGLVMLADADGKPIITPVED